MTTLHNHIVFFNQANGEPEIYAIDRETVMVDGETFTRTASGLERADQRWKDSAEEAQKQAVAKLDSAIDRIEAARAKLLGIGGTPMPAAKTRKVAAHMRGIVEAWRGCRECPQPISNLVLAMLRDIGEAVPYA